MTCILAYVTVLHVLPRDDVYSCLCYTCFLEMTCILAHVTRVSAGPQYREPCRDLLANLHNIRAIVNHFSPKIEGWSTANKISTPAPEEVTRVVVLVTRVVVLVTRVVVLVTRVVVVTRVVSFL